jgi:Flp pilus assembly protein CpaB
VRTVAPAPPETEAVLVASRDLPAGAVIGGDDLELVRVPPETVPNGTVAREDAIGRTVAAPVRGGEALTDVRLVTAALLDGYPGLVAVPVRIPDAGAVGLLAVGDRVDVLAADPSGRAEAELVASSAPVIALPRDDPDAAGTALTGTLGGRLMVLGATRQTAARLAGASAWGLLTVSISD